MDQIYSRKHDRLTVSHTPQNCIIHQYNNYFIHALEQFETMYGDYTCQETPSTTPTVIL